MIPLSSRLTHVLMLLHYKCVLVQSTTYCHVLGSAQRSEEQEKTDITKGSQVHKHLSHTWRATCWPRTLLPATWIPEHHVLGSRAVMSICTGVFPGMSRPVQLQQQPLVLALTQVVDEVSQSRLSGLELPEQNLWEGKTKSVGEPTWVQNQQWNQDHRLTFTEGSLQID